MRHKIFVSYHHKGDQEYYDKFSQTFHDNYETIYDNSLREIDSDNPEYIIQRIRDEFIHGTSCTIVLVGEHTHGRKYVDWEIKATLDKGHGLIGVQLPSAKVNNGKVTIPGRLHDNIATKFALWFPWSTLVASTAGLSDLIADAKSREEKLINNTRERMSRNTAG